MGKWEKKQQNKLKSKMQFRFHAHLNCKTDQKIGRFIPPRPSPMVKTWDEWFMVHPNHMGILDKE